MEVEAVVSDESSLLVVIIYKKTEVLLYKL